MKLVPHNKVLKAYTNWGGKPEPGQRHSFWGFIGVHEPLGEYQYKSDSWTCSAEGARKIELMCSPHWKTLLKAYEAKYGKKEHTL